VQKTKDRQRLVASPDDIQRASIGSDHFKQSDDRTHARAVDQAKGRKVDEHLRRPFFADFTDDRPELGDRDCIELTFDAEDGGAMLCAEFEVHTLCQQLLVTSPCYPPSGTDRQRPLIPLRLLPSRRLKRVRTLGEPAT
jgi:hypothetical protein